VSAAGVYGLVFVACLVNAIGLARWESRRPG
jgi:hypothetical protein